MPNTYESALRNKLERLSVVDGVQLLKGVGLQCPMPAFLLMHYYSLLSKGAGDILRPFFLFTF